MKVLAVEVRIITGNKKIIIKTITIEEVKMIIRVIPVPVIVINNQR